MFSIEKSIDEAQGITTLEFRGELSLKVTLDTLEEFYSQPTKHLIWDITRADIQTATTDDLKKIVSVTKSHAKSRPGGKTAILGNSDLQYALGRMYATFCEFERHPIEISVFRNLDSAMQWLQSPD
jgi:hypothetical protein